ncbi:MAG: signal peptidase I [Bacilli bacterium]|nr:signal peptidase I [Bacilli bacterium]
MKIKKIVSYIFFSFFILIFLIAIILNFSGYQSFVVISSSMHPAIPKYSLVYVKTYDLEDMNSLQIGDVIAVRTSSEPLLHRIIKIEGEEIYTQGDANDEVDAAVTYSKVIGKKAFFIPLIGVLFLSPYPWLILVGLIIIYFLIKQLKKEIQKK